MESENYSNSNEFSLDSSYGNLKRKIDEIIKNHKIIFFIPSGSNRYKLISDLKKSYSNLYVIGYKQHEGVDYVLEKVDSNIVDHIGRKLSENMIIIAIPRDTTTAFHLARYFSSSSLGNQTIVYYLPALHEDIIGKKNIDEWLLINHEHLKNSLNEINIGPRLKGLNIKLYQNPNSNDKEAVEKIRKLGKEFMGIKKLLAEISSDTAIPIWTIVVLSSFIKSIFLIDVLAILLESLNDRLLPKFIERLRKKIKKQENVFLNYLAENKELKKNFVEDLAQFIITVKEAKDYVNDDRYEALVDEIASSWGLTIDEFKIFINNISKLIESNIVTEADVKKLNEQIDNRISEKIKKLKVMLNAIGFYDSPDSWFIYSKNGKWVIKWDNTELVTEGIFNEMANKILSKIERDGSNLIVIKGSMGSGKSRLAEYVMANLLKKGWSIYYPSSINEIINRNIKNTLIRMGEEKYPIAILFDVFPPELYGDNRGEVARLGSVNNLYESITENVNLLVDLSTKFEIPVLIVMPSNIYDVLQSKLSSEKKRYLKENIIDFDEEFNKSVNSTLEFIKGIIETYSHCKDSTKNEILGKLILKEFKGNYALISKYVGLVINETNCKIDNVEQIIGKAKGDVNSLIALIIWEVYFRSDKRIASYLAVPLIIRGKFGAIPMKFFEEPVTIKNIDNEVRLEYIDYYTTIGGNAQQAKYFIRWLSMRKEDLVENILRDLIVNNASSVNEEVKEVVEPLIDALNDAKNKMGKISVDREEAITQITLKSFIHYLNEIEMDEQAKRRFLYILGSAISDYPVEAIQKFKETYSNVFPITDKHKMDKLLLVESSDGYYVPQIFYELFSNFVLSEGRKDLEKSIESNNTTLETISLTNIVNKVGSDFLCSEINRVTNRIQESKVGLPLIPYLAGLSLLGMTAQSGCINDALYLSNIAIPQMLVGGYKLIWYLIILANQVSRVLRRKDKNLLIDNVSPVLYSLTLRYSLEPRHTDLCKQLVWLLNGISYGVTFQWSIAWLIKTYNLLSTLCSVPKEVAQNILLKKGKITDPGLMSILNIDSLESEIITSINSGKLDEAESKIRDLENQLKGVSITNEVREYLRWHDLDVTYEEFINDLINNTSAFINGYRGRIYFLKGLASDDPSYLRQAINFYQNASRNPKEIGNYLSYKPFEIMLKMLITDSITQLDTSELQITTDVQTLWNNIVNNFINVLIMSLTIPSTALAYYIILLALTGKEYQDLMANYGSLLNFASESKVLTQLMLTILGDKNQITPSKNEVLKVFKPDMNPVYLPALEYTTMLNTNNFDSFIDECMKLDAIHKLICQEIILSIKQKKKPPIPLNFKRPLEIQHNEVQSILNSLSNEQIVEILAPKSLLSRLPFILLSIIENNCKLAKAHILHEVLNTSYKYYERILKDLYVSLGDECTINDNAKLLLAKLFYLSLL
ncbi:hypothetical protein V6M85_08030 [Sulfolobus tengchongensis]|uniref:ATP-binding protein n=1 Tax=Sulfolobus tengchongensis TaxID=207809 RepID=A0AAX4KZP0_9CREN